MPASPHRPLLRASLLSLALHSVVLIGVVPTLPLRIEMPAARIQAVLGSTPTFRPADLPVAKAKPSPKQALVGSSKGSLSRTVATMGGPVVAPQIPPEAPSPAIAAPSPPLVGGSEQSAVPGNTVESVRGNAAGAPSQGVSADDLRRYRLSLAISARSFKRYPLLARERGWEGTAEVSIVVDPLLPAPRVSLSESSGIAMLDAQAVDMVEQAARTAPLPEGLKGRGFRVLLPVKFSLEADR
jgi:protein TonB